MMRSRENGGFIASLLVVLLLVAGGVIVSSPRSSSSPPAVSGASAPARAGDEAEAAFGTLPLWFEANRGQAAPEADYVARVGGENVLLTEEGPVLTVSPRSGGKDESRRFRLGLMGGNRVRPEGLERLPGTSNYLLGGDPAGWRTGVPHFGQVAYRGVWPGVDLVYRGQGRQLEYDFVVLPGADPATIGVVVEGAESVTLTPEGDLVASAGDAELRQSRPVLYQQVGGARRPVGGSFILTGPNTFGFHVGAYDRSRPLVIDPVLSWSTALGGRFGDSVTGISVDPSGSAYVTGSTASTNFPTINPFQPAISNEATTDVFVAKLNPAGNGLLWSTYLGGGLADDGAGIAVDGAGNATVVGSTSSTNFPTRDSYQAAKGAGATADAFVARLDAAGGLTYSTYLGGGGVDTGRGVAVDPAGRAHVTGATASTNFPSFNPYQPTKGTGTTPDAFVALLDPGASGAASLLYSSYLGGGADDVGAAIAVDPAGRSYITGETRSANFPTAAALKGTISGACPTINNPGRLCREAFVAKLDPSAGGPPSLVWSTYLGGSTSTFHLEIGEAGLGIAVDGSGSAYVTGETASDDFPAVGAVQATRTGDFDAFVTKLSPAGDAIVYSTYLGGAGQDVGRAIAVDPTGSAHVTGRASPSFPTVDPVGAVGSSTDAFLARLGPSGSVLVHSNAPGRLER